MKTTPLRREAARRWRESPRGSEYNRVYQVGYRVRNKHKWKEYRERWKTTNPEKFKESQLRGVRNYRNRNIEKVREQSRIHHRTRQATDRENHKLWLKRNPHKIQEYNSRRRFLRNGAQGFHTAREWLERVAFFLWRCRYCGVQLTSKTLTQDHQIPLTKGGTNWPSNLVPACSHCNHSKRTRAFKEFMHVIHTV